MSLNFSLITTPYSLVFVSVVCVCVCLSARVAFFVLYSRVIVGWIPISTTRTQRAYDRQKHSTQMCVDITKSKLINKQLYWYCLCVCVCVISHVLCVVCITGAFPVLHLTRAPTTPNTVLCSTSRTPYRSLQSVCYVCAVCASHTQNKRTHIWACVHVVYSLLQVMLLRASLSDIVLVHWTSSADGMSRGVVWGSTGLCTCEFELCRIIADGGFDAVCLCVPRAVYVFVNSFACFISRKTRLLLKERGKRCWVLWVFAACCVCVIIDTMSTTCIVIFSPIFSSVIVAFDQNVCVRVLCVCRCVRYITWMRMKGQVCLWNLYQSAAHFGRDICIYRSDVRTR